MPAAVHHPRHRLAHAAPGVGDQAAALDLRAGLRERRGERVADREVAQVAGVQRLGRVGVPELDREALPGREVRERRLRAAARLERGAAWLRSSRRRGAPSRPRVARHPAPPKARLRSARAPAASRRPRASGQPRHELQVVAREGAAAPAPPSARAPPVGGDVLEVVEKIYGVMAALGKDGSPLPCTSRGSNPDQRRLRPSL